jgi:hypothetical protein
VESKGGDGLVVNMSGQHVCAAVRAPLPPPSNMAHGVVRQGFDPGLHSLLLARLDARA